MHVTVESNAGLERTLRIEVPAASIDGKIDDKLQSLTKTVRLNGFRPGKVPLGVVRRQFLGQVEQEVLGDVLQSSFYEAVSQEALRPAGTPRIEPEERNTGQDLVYKASFEVYPEIELADLNGQAIEKVSAEVAESDIDDMVESLRKQRANWSAASRPAIEGDRLTLNFAGVIDGEPFDGGKGEGTQLTLGSGRFLPEFEAALFGADTDSEHSFPVTFPDDYGSKDLAGKTAQFDVTVTLIEESELPEVDDELAETLGIEEGGVGALRAKIAENLGRELDTALAAKQKQSILDVLLERNQIEIPKSLVDEEVHKLAHGKQGHDAHDHDVQDALRPEAERRVALGLILAEIVQRNELKADAADVRAEIEKMAQPFDDSEAVVSWYYSQEERLREIEAMVLENAVMNWALDQMVVMEKPESFAEVVARG